MSLTFFFLDFGSKEKSVSVLWCSIFKCILCAYYPVWINMTNKKEQKQKERNTVIWKRTSKTLNTLFWEKGGCISKPIPPRNRASCLNLTVEEPRRLEIIKIISLKMQLLGWSSKSQEVTFQMLHCKNS